MPQTRRSSRKSYFLDNFTNGVTRVMDSVFSSFLSSVEKESDVLINKLERRTAAFQRKVMNGILVSFLAGLGVLFLLSSAYFYMRDSLFMSRAGSFMVLAAIFLVLSWAARKRIGGGHHETETY